MRRDLVIFAAAVLALLAALGVTAATLADAGVALRGVEDATRSTDLPAWTPRLGVNANLRLYEADALESTLAQMRGANITWVRQNVPWASVEAAPGVLDWAEWDRVFAPFAAEPQLRVVAVLTGAPAWAADPAAPDSAAAPPADPAAFAQFAAAFAARYGDVIDHYQVWDEPNLASGWGGLEPRPAAYLALLAAAYDAIHGADARATVLAAGLAPTTETGPQNLSDALYLDRLLALGGAAYMDAAAGKPFGFDASPLDRTVAPDVLNFSRLILLREILLKHGLAEMPLWATGWGWNSLPATWTGAPSIWGAVNAEAQAAYTVAALDRAEREWPWLGGMTLHLWQPNAATDDPQWGFAVIGPDGTLPTPLYAALAARPALTASRDGLYAPANPFAAYSGAWRFGPLGADIGPYQDSQALFTFSGSEVALKLRQDDFVAYFFVEIDGAPANALPKAADGSAYLILTSDTLRPETGLTTLATGLGDGPHTLRLVADRGWDRWALAGYAVSSGDLAAPYRDQLAVAVFTVVITALAVGVSAARLDWRAFSRTGSRFWRMLGAAGQILLSAAAALALMLGMLLSFGGVLPDLLRRDPAALGLTAGAALLLYLSPPLLLALAAAAALFVIFFHRPDLGLMLTVFFAPFYLFPVELYRFAFPMAELVLLLLAGAWLLRLAVDWAARRKQPERTATAGVRGALARLTALDVCVAAYLALGGVALFVSAQRGPALTELRVLFIEPALFYLILRHTARDEAMWLRLADTLVAAAVVVAAVGLAQYAFGQSVVIAEGGTGRLASVYGSPNNAALFLERALPFAAVFLLTRFDARRRWFGALAAVVIGAALALTFSAGALFLGVPLALALVLALHFGRRAVWILGGLALLVGAALALALQTERFARLANLSGGTSFFRVRVWQSAAQMLRDHPVTGIGLDQFLYAYRGQYIAPDAWQEPNLSHPHNILLDFWLRLGLLGAALLIVIQIAFWARALRVWRWAAGALVSRALIIGAMGSMLGLLAHGLVDNSVFVNDLALVFMLLLALAASLPAGRAPARDRL